MDTGLLALGVCSNNNNNDNQPLLIQYNFDGSLNHSFGTKGIAIYNTNIESITPIGFGFIQNKTKIVIMNLSSNGPVIIRTNLNGSFDASLGGKGYIKLDLRSSIPLIVSEVSAGFLVLPNNQMVSGCIKNTENGLAFALYRLNYDCSIDTTFGIDGLASLPVPNKTIGLITSSALQQVNNNQTKIVCCGINWNTLSQNEVSSYFFRFHFDGTLDASFGNKGEMIIPSCSFVSYIFHTVSFVWYTKYAIILISCEKLYYCYWCN